jgi:PAS domain S-box-containing protein
MQATPSSSATTAELRRRAEALLRERRDDRKYAADTQRLVHELQVHQVELEMQNTALQEARDRMEGLVEKYADLYDFAPVGYFSVDGEGRVLEANLTGAALLGMERSRLIGRRLPQFVAPASKTTFQDFLEGVFAGTGKRVCEALMMRQDGAPFWVNFHANSAVAFSGPRKGCRLAVSDITLLKQAQEAQQRTDALTISNRELKLEIVRRQAVEEALRQSEQHQASLLDQSRHMQEQLRHLSHQLLQAQEEERRRISRELHDQITQTLVGINVHLETLAREA